MNRSRACALAAITFALTLSACGSDDDTTTETSSTNSGSSSAKGAGAVVPGIRSMDELYKGNVGRPPTSGPAAQKDKFVVVVSCGQISPGCSTPTDGFVAAAKQLGWRTKVVDGRQNANNGWINGIRTAVAQKPDAIATIALDCSGVKQGLLDARRAKIPTLGIEALDCDDETNPGGPAEKLYTVPNILGERMKSTGDFYDTWGDFLMSYIVNRTGGKAKVVYVNFEGVPLTAHWKKGAMSVIEKCKGCEVVDYVDAAVSDTASAGLVGKKLAPALLKNPDANAVQFGSDVMSVLGGGAKAVADSGRKGDLIVSGGEGSPAAMDLVRDDKGVSANLGIPLEWMGWGAADQLNRYFAGEDAVPQGIGFQIVDKDHNLPAPGKGYEASVDFKTSYAKLWSAK